MFNVAWSGQDDAGGSGIASYDVFVSVDGGEFSLWLDDTTDTSAAYIGEMGSRYAFYSVATDNVGHEETAPPTADAETFIVPPSDFDRDGDVDGEDFLIWQTNFPTESGASEDTATPTRTATSTAKTFSSGSRILAETSSRAGRGVSGASEIAANLRRWSSTSSRWSRIAARQSESRPLSSTTSLPASGT